MIVSAAKAPATAAAVSAPSLEDAKQQRLADKLRVAKQALAALKRSATRPNDEQKARAREKLESIRKRLEQLRMMGGTPRQIAALARELKEAVRAYGQAGGSAAEAGASSADTAQSAEAVSNDAVPGEANASDDVKQDTASAGSTASEAPVAAPAADADKPANATEGRVENPYDKAIAAHAESVAAAARKSSEGQDDRDFVQKARQLAEQLKSAAIQAAQMAKQSGKTVDAAEAAEATKAAEDADKAVEEVRQAMGGGALLSVSSVSA